MDLRKKFQPFFTAFFFLLLTFGFLFARPAFADTFTLSGNVSDSTGSDIENATVEVIDPSNSTTVASTTTNSEGDYTTIINGGTYNVQVTPPVGSDFSSATALSQSITANTTLNFTLVDAGSAVLEGRVYDPLGNPLANQKIELIGGTSQSATTNGSGFYSIQALTGTYTLIISEAGSNAGLNAPLHYVIFVNNFSLNESKILNITLPAKQVTVHVQDSSNNPISNVLLNNQESPVQVSGLSIGGGITNATGFSEYHSSLNPKTNASGSATLWLFPNSAGTSYDLKATPPSGSNFSQTILPNVFITNDTDVTITLPQSFVLDGIVYDPLGNPLANQKIELIGNTSQSTTTNGSGEYSIQAVSGTYTLIISDTGLNLGLNAPAHYVIFANNFSLTQDRDLDITIPAKKVDVHIENAQGQPVDDVLLNNQESPVQVSGLSIGGGITNATGFSEYHGSTQPKTDSEGDVTLWLFPNSAGTSYDLKATPPSGSNYLQTIEPNVVISEDTDLTIVMQQPQFTFSGHLSDAVGSSISGQKIQLQGGGTLVSDVTDEFGDFSIQTVAGDYTLTITEDSSNAGLNAPLHYVIFKNNFSLTEDTDLNLTIPAKQVTVHVQNQDEQTVSDILLTTQESPVNVSGLSIGGGIVDATGFSEYHGSTYPTTDSSGNATLWLFPNSEDTYYELIATPPSESEYSQFTLSNVVVTGNQTEIISLQNIIPPYFEGTFTASDYHFDRDTKILSFTASNFNPPRFAQIEPINDVMIAQDGSSITLAYYSYQVGNQPNLPNNMTEFNVQLQFNPTFQTELPSDDTLVYIAIAQGGSGNYWSQQIPANVLAPALQPVTTTFDSIADTYVRSGQANQNEGAGQFMNVQSSGDNRSLVRFDQSAIQSEVGAGEVLSAKLRVTIVDNGNNWGTGRTVDVHRLISDWAEGNGTENDRGEGNGATWNCAIDSLIENQAKNCSGATEWEMGQPNNPAVHPWVETATDSETITNGQIGIVEYDVTDDLESFMNGTNSNYGWLIKKTNEGQNGQVSFGTKESASVPQLVVTYQP